MERTLVFAASAAVPRGNHVEVAQVREGEPDAGLVVAVTDLDRGIRYQLHEVPRERIDVWRAYVRVCAVVNSEAGPHTELVVASDDPAEAAIAALREADQAAAAATAESDRWGGSDKRPAEEPHRFW